MYQIYVDRFCNGDPTNDVQTNEYQYIGAKGAACGGLGTAIRRQWTSVIFTAATCRACMDKMDYLQDLGIEVIYFNPLFVSPSNHKYDIQDYDYIDPHIGKIVDDGGELLQDWQNGEPHGIQVISTV